MGRSPVIYLACLAAIAALGADSAETLEMDLHAYADRAGPSHRQFEVSPFLAGTGVDVSALPTISPLRYDSLTSAPALSDREITVVPLPPALAGTGVLVGGWVALRTLRAMRRHLPRRRP